MKKISSEKNVQMLVYLLKKNNIKKIIVSPGTTNGNFVCSVQGDPFFELYSSVDERSAAYMACGMCFESGEPVVITCTGATASRNYLPGLSEAYYRKLPIIAITASQDICMTGHLSPQFIDRSVHPIDSVIMSVNLQNIFSKNDEWDCNIKINKALQEIKRHGGGPVHINLSTLYSNESVSELPDTRFINRYYTTDVSFPNIPKDGRIAISIGGHKMWDNSCVKIVEKFCEAYNAVAFVDHSSQYHGKYAVNPSIIAAQEYYKSDIFNIRLLIHIGEQHGDYYTNGAFSVREVWRISPDGEMRDTFRQLTNIFEMEEKDFFNKYTSEEKKSNTTYYNECVKEKEKLFNNIPDIPLSNVWVASVVMPKLSEGTTVQLGVSNTQRAWTFFDFPKGVTSIANIGCRGIDGTLSTVLGMSLTNNKTLHLCVLGDLSFFYDMNALGNRHVGKNLRIILINNGIGAEFKIYHHRLNIMMGNDTNEFVAAEGHFANKSKTFVKHYAEDLGFDYLSAENKNEVLDNLNQLLNQNSEKPIIMEVFTNEIDESAAIKAMRNIETDQSLIAKSKAKSFVKGVLGAKGTEIVKNMVKS